MNINLYLSSTLCWSYPIDKVIEIASRHGFKGVEVWAEQVWYHNTPIEEILKAKKQYRVDLTFHAASWDLNMCSLNTGIRLQSVKEIEKSFQLAKEIEAFNVTVHPGKRTLTEEWTSWHSNVLEDSLQSLASTAELLGVTMSLELMEQEKKEFISKPLQMNNLLEHLTEGVKSTFDVAHVPLDKDVLDYYKKLSRVNKIHISDSTSSKYHVPLGKGNIQVETLLYMITEESVPVVLEGFDELTELKVLRENIEFLTYHSIFSRKEMMS